MRISAAYHTLDDLFAEDISTLIQAIEQVPSQKLRTVHNGLIDLAHRARSFADRLSEAG